MSSDTYTRIKSAIYMAMREGYITLDECDRRLIQLADFYYGKRF